MNSNRRAFFKRGLSAVAAVSMTQFVANRAVFAADLPHVDEASPQANGLGYKHDATQTDVVKFARYQAGQACAGCALYQGVAGAEWGGCGIFAGQAVAAKGWCSAFAAKA
ncbi:MAG: High potential iron-sulfur protein [Gammaproteobacteria bacterium]|nr:High potential iron-sulfur protein [Gammaproteobacteria bacterium]